MSKLKLVSLLILVVVTAACSTTGHKGAQPLMSTRMVLDVASETAGNGEYIEELMESRTWVRPRYLTRK
jgi:hypothetical protein